MPGPAPAWLTARPIAHRGLHDAKAGVIENTPSSVAAAVAAGYGIEVDLQISADGEALVFHDDTLARLTDRPDSLAAMTAAAIRAVPLKATSDRIMTLAGLFDLVGGRVPLVLELKSRFDGDQRVAERTAALASGYAGPVAAMSFDPTLIETLRRMAPHMTRGIVAERHYHAPATGFRDRWQNFSLGSLLHARQTRPHFIAYSVHDLPAAAPSVARSVFGRPLLTWTVRTKADVRTARRHADQMIFEGFRP